jgi:hypothetical protein
LAADVLDRLADIPKGDFPMENNNNNNNNNNPKQEIETFLRSVKVSYILTLQHKQFQKI